MTDTSHVVPDADTHLLIAEIAVQQGFIGVADVGKILLELPSMYAHTHHWTTKRVWVDGGPLDETEWLAVQDELARRAAHDDPPDEPHEFPTNLAHMQAQARYLDPIDTIQAEGFQDPEHYRGDATQRYLLGSVLGKGGAGRVVRAYDRMLRRVVALKIPHGFGANHALTKLLQSEARTTGQLEHPNIVPVYDYGVLNNGEHFYTMKRISGRSLRDVLRDVRAQRAAALDRWPESQLLRVIVEVCRALEFAHHHGTLHRDLKPENIMLGDFGEVYVMDWGLAQCADITDLPAPEPTDKNHHYPTVGTPAYMSPEQASGVAELDQRTDIYSLGVMLYEILTHVVPSRRDSVVETLLAVASETILPPSTVATNRHINPELDDIVMRALEKDAAKRYPTVKQLRVDLEIYLSGRRPLTAERSYRASLALIETYDQGVAQVTRLRKRARRLAAQIAPSDTIGDKREYWRASERVDIRERQLISVYERAVEELHKTLLLDPAHEGAQLALASLAWRKYCEAQQARDPRQTDYFRTLVRQYDTAGQYTRLLEHATSLHLTADIPGTHAFIQQIEGHDRRLQPTTLRYIGEPPLEIPSLPRGSWLITLKAPGIDAIRLPILARADRPLRVHVNASRASELPTGFTFVPNGESQIGGDYEALDPLPAQTITLHAFGASGMPVLISEYLEWIQYLAMREPGLAEAHLPVLSNGAPLIRRFADDTFRICPNAMRWLNPEATIDEDFPIVGIRADDALAYLEWRSRKEHRNYRLPTELEYERMTRGADGRMFSWGDTFDPALCVMRLSSEAVPRLKPAGHALSDIGPFGHRDLSGNARELCTSSLDPKDMVLRGGSWMTDATACRAASRMAYPPGRRHDDVTFRIVCPL